MALKRRDIPELLAEELRRLDEDDTYAAAAKRLVKLAGNEPADRGAARRAALAERVAAS